MRADSIFKSTFLKIIFLLLSTGQIFCQKKAEEEFLGKADLYKAKKSALEYLGNSLIVKKYGMVILFRIIICKLL